MEASDGQTIKTRNLAELLEKRLNIRVKRVDTIYSKTNKPKLLFDTVYALASCRHIFLLVSVNGIKTFLPLLFYLNKVFRRHIYHYVIGSEILEMVQRDCRLVKYLNAFDANWFEYESGTRFLQGKGVENVTTLPNFKDITPCDDGGYTLEGEYRFCTFSRVMEEKGITDAVEAVKELNRKSGRKIASVDIYGAVDPAYRQRFDQLMSENRECAAYRGVCESNGSVDVLKDYYALLFPTRWAGEGVPGTVIDAYASGLPVIATDWNANREIVVHGKTGILYPSPGYQTLTDAVWWAVHHRDAVVRMRSECRQAYENYTPDKIYGVISEAMNRAQGRDAAGRKVRNKIEGGANT